MANFSARAYRVGSSIVMTVPAILVREKIVKLGKVYDVEIKGEVKNGKSS